MIKVFAPYVYGGFLTKGEKDIWSSRGISGKMGKKGQENM